MLIDFELKCCACELSCDKYFDEIRGFVFTVKLFYSIYYIVCFFTYNILYFESIIYYENDDLP